MKYNFNEIENHLFGLIEIKGCNKVEKSYLAKLIQERRAVKKYYNDKEVQESLVRELLNIARWAPTHGLRQPWRFIFVGKEEIPAFAKKIAATYPEEKQENRERYLNEPNAILVAVMEVPEEKKQEDENFGAIAALIQNLWLLAWEKGLGMVWKTNPHIYNDEVKKMLDVKENEKIVGFIHMGYFDDKPMSKDRIPIDEKFTRYKD